MSQHDYILANAAGATFRADLNNALAAIVSQNSGATEPATMSAYQFWADTATGILKQRNAANTTWISLMTLSTGVMLANAALTSSALSNDFRLSLTTAVPVTTADVTGATTIYAVPKTGNRIALHNGTQWVNYISAEFSLALGTLTASKPYDVFCYQNAGDPTLEFLAWTNATTRATGLAYDTGVLIKSGDATRRYLGTFYTTSTTQTEDSAVNRLLWNYYHRAARRLYVKDATASWAYTTATVRFANNNAANQFQFVVGVAEDSISLGSHQVAANTNTGVLLQGGVQLDTYTTIVDSNAIATTAIANGFVPLDSAVTLAPQLGYHYVALVEVSTATGTTTWYGSGTQSGMFGSIWA